MSEMIERVARAMFDDEVIGVSSEMAEASWNVPGHADRWRQRARAAIEAMREPTEAMKERGFQYTADPCWPDDVGRAWRHMIDEALK